MGNRNSDLREAAGIRVQFSPDTKVSFEALQQLMDGENQELELPGKLIFEAIDKDGVPVTWDNDDPPEGGPF
jgi:hypothetical protein